MQSSDQQGGAAPLLKADFDFAPACPTEGSTVQFWDRSAGSPAGWAWTIEKEAISSSPGASHDFEAAGVYTVSLTVTKDGRSETATKTVRVANQVITFYSYKGGVGRSMALANIGCLLADRKGDKGVLLVDWDLEAPGLHRFFRDQIKQTLPPGKGVDEVIDAKPGLIDLFLEVESTLRNKSPTTPASDDAIREAFDRVALDQFVMETGVPSLRLMKAGRFDDGSYSRRVNTFQWEGLYKDYPGVIRAFADRLAKEYRYVLIDSRTGLTDISGICTMLMPEKLVVVFTPNRQSLTGVIDLVRRASIYRRGSDDLRPLLVFPLPSRIENARPALREVWRSGDADSDIPGYQPQFEKLFEEVYQLSGCELSEYFDEVQIQQVPDYAYGEEIAVRVEGRRDRLSLTRSYSAFAERLVDSPAPWVAPPVPVASPSLPPPETRPTPLDAIRVQTLAPGSSAEPPGEAQAPARARRGWLLPAAVALLALAVISVFVLKRKPGGVQAAQPTPGSLPTKPAAVAVTPAAVAPAPPPTREAGIPAHQLASRALALLGVGTRGPEVPLLLSVEAHRKSDTFETRSALFAALEATPRFGVPLSGVGRDVLALAFLEDGRTVLALGPSPGLIWNVDSQAVARKINLPSGVVRKATVSANGQILAVGGIRAIVPTTEHFVWTSAVGERSKPVMLTLHAEVLGLALSKTGDVLAVADGDGSVTLWDNAGRSKGKIVVDRAGSEFTIALSPDGKTLASGGIDGKITLWDLVRLQPLGAPLGGPASAAEARHPPGSLGERVLAASRTGRRRTNRLVLTGERPSSTQQKRRAYQSPRTAFSSPRMAFSPDGKLLAASSADNSILLWDIAKHTPGSPLIGHRTAVTTIAFAPDGKQLASGAEDGTVILWDVPAYQPLGQPLRSGMTATGAVAFSLDGNRLAASSGPNVMLWDVTLSDDRACNAAKRNLTVAEWQTYLGTEPYRQTCRTLPNYGK